MWLVYPKLRNTNENGVVWLATRAPPNLALDTFQGCVPVVIIELPIRGFNFLFAFLFKGYSSALVRFFSSPAGLMILDIRHPLDIVKHSS